MTLKMLKKYTPVIAAFLLIGLALSSKFYLPNNNTIHLGKPSQSSKKGSDPFRLMIDIKQATLTREGINTYTLTFNADYMERITALASPPSKRTKSLTVYEYRELAHEGNKSDFDHKHPSVFLHLKGKAMGVYTLYSYTAEGKHVIYKLRLDNKAQYEIGSSSLKPITGRATLFINHLCCL